MTTKTIYRSRHATQVGEDTSNNLPNAPFPLRSACRSIRFSHRRGVGLGACICELWLSHCPKQIARNFSFSIQALLFAIGLVPVSPTVIIVFSWKIVSVSCTRLHSFFVRWYEQGKNGCSLFLLCSVYLIMPTFGAAAGTISISFVRCPREKNNKENKKNRGIVLARVYGGCV